MTEKGNLQICPLQERDGKEVALLEQEIFGTPWSGEAVKEAILRAGETPSGNSYGEVCGVSYGAFGAFWEGRLAGYLFATVVAGEGELHRIAVSPKLRRMGIGDALIRAFLSWSLEHGAGGIWLEVRAGNQAAVSLYQKYGFSAAGRRKRYYQNPTEDALVFVYH